MLCLERCTSHTCDLTSWVGVSNTQLPSARLLSLAFTTFFAAYPNPSLVPDVDANGVVPDPEFPSPKAATMFRMQFHPRYVGRPPQCAGRRATAASMTHCST